MVRNVALRVHAALKLQPAPAAIKTDFVLQVWPPCPVSFMRWLGRWRFAKRISRASFVDGRASLYTVSKSPDTGG
jgi:hypothetical protein